VKAGICSIIWKERMDIFDVVVAAVRVGAEGIEVWGQPPHIPDAADLDHVAKIREAMEANGLAAPQYGSYVSAGKAGFIAEIKQELAITAELGAVACRLWAGPGDSEVLDADQWAATMADLKEACAMAADMSVLITLERHSGTANNTIWGCQRVIDEVDSPALKINYQVANTCTDTITEEIRILGPHILNCHATNSRQTTEARVMTRLADGDIDWAGLIENLRAAGNDGFVEVEFVRRGDDEISLEETESELAADVAFLKECMGG